MSRPYLDFYIENDVSPVVKEIKNKNQFFIQRSYLYQTLGILTAFRGKKILELGPGNGVNAIYNYSLQPEKYVLVDANPLAIENIKKNLSKNFNNCQVDICYSLIEDFPHEPSYDIVICENMLSNQNNPGQFARMVSGNVAHDGILVVTCNDAVSVLSEVLRAFIGLLVSNSIESFSKKAEYLASFFSTHLSALNSVDREPQDWVIDNIINTGFSLDAKLFSISEAIAALSHEFIFYNSSPRFFNDMRWFKSVHKEEEFRRTNTMVEACYYTNIINLLDYRSVHAVHSVALGKEIMNLAVVIRETGAAYFKTFDKSFLRSLIEHIRALAKLIEAVASDTSRSLYACAHIFETEDYQLMQTNPALMNWWGRGTQYVSFIRDTQK